MRIPSIRLNRTSIFWGIGHWSAQGAFSLLGVQFMLYLTNYVGVAPALAGAALAFARLADIPTDVVVGVMSDRIDTPWGRRRPWILAGAVLLAVSVIVIFHSDMVRHDLVLPLATATVLAVFVGYSCVHIPLVAMSAEITGSYRERGSLWGYGMLFTTLGTTTGTAFTPFLLKKLGGGIPAYHGASWVLAAITLVLGLVCVIGTAKAPRTTPEVRARNKMSVAAWVASLTSNGPLAVYTLYMSISGIGFGLLTAGMPFYIFSILRAGQNGMIVYGSWGVPGAVIGLVLFLALMKRIPKHVLAASSAIAMSVLVLGLRLMNASTPLWWFGALCLVWGTLAMSMSFMGYSLLPDIIRSDVLKTGLNREGAIASLSAAIQKTIPALSTLVFGILLSGAGYVTGKGEIAQPQSAVDMVYLTVCIVPGVLLLISGITLLVFYNLTESRLAQMESDAVKEG